MMLGCMEYVKIHSEQGSKTGSNEKDTEVGSKLGANDSMMARNRVLSGTSS